LNNSEFLINNLCTKGFYIIDDFLKEEQCKSLRTTVQEQYAQGLFRGAKIGLNINQHENTTIRKDEILWLNDAETNLEIRIFLEKINQLADLLNQSIFLGLHEIEAHFASYQPGTYYKKHCDQFANQKTRKITFVYYLNKDWQDEYGGLLNLYNTENQLIQKVIPLENRFICFNSELPHEVSVTHKPRYSITGWMKTRPL
jgi:SM-20-related protein